MKRIPNKTIHVIDDNEQFLITLTQILEYYEFKVESFSNPLTYLTFIQNQEDKPALIVLTDIIMPLMDGYELIHHAIKINPNLKFITMTGAYINYCPEESSIIGHLYKPFAFNTLSQTIQSKNMYSI